MPIFEYDCAGCGTRFEHLVLHSSPGPRCPSCQGTELTRVMSRVAVSSEQSRKRTLRGARARANAVRYEKDHEEHKRIHRHLDHEH